MKLLEANTKNLEFLISLSSGTLKIPYNQRPYAWKKEQVLRLFNDLYAVYSNPGSEHILNFITLKEDEENSKVKFIYDGQQRVVTLTLLLSAIVNRLQQVDVNPAEGLRKKFLYNSVWKRDGDEIQYKVIFEAPLANQMLHECIMKNIELNQDHVFSDYDSALYDNYNYLKELIDIKFHDSSDINSLLDFVESILEKVHVIIIETSYENIAEEMFETLNSTGLQLENFYILKNSLIRKLGEDDVRDEWSTIESNTDRINKNKFLNAYVNAINGKTTSTAILSTIFEIKDLDSNRETKIFLQELLNASRIYLEIENPSQKTDTNHEELLLYNKQINFLSKIHANQYKPIIISMGLKNYSLNKINQVLKKIISLQVRNIFISEINANTLEQFYPSLARRIYIEDAGEFENILNLISEQIVSDSILREKFNSRIISTRTEESTIRMILKEIYNSDHPEILINGNNREVNLEHILPKNPDANSRWLTDFADDEIRYFSTRLIGNLTVVLGRINSTIKNSDFIIKKEAYAESNIPENVQLGQLSEWNKEAILRRCESLFLKFIRIWSK